MSIWMSVAYFSLARINPQLMPGAAAMARTSGITRVLPLGEQEVLFLRQYSPDHYLVVGGLSGRFRIAKGQVTPATNQGVHLSWPVPDGAFFTRVQQA
jgi:hypothetical protein